MLQRASPTQRAAIKTFSRNPQMRTKLSGNLDFSLLPPIGVDSPESQTGNPSSSKSTQQARKGEKGKKKAKTEHVDKKQAKKSRKDTTNQPQQYKTFTSPDSIPGISKRNASDVESSADSFSEYDDEGYGDDENALNYQSSSFSFSTKFVRSSATSSSSSAQKRANPAKRVKPMVSGAVSALQVSRSAVSDRKGLTPIKESDVSVSSNDRSSIEEMRMAQTIGRGGLANRASSSRLESGSNDIDDYDGERDGESGDVQFEDVSSFPRGGMSQKTQLKGGVGGGGGDSAEGRRTVGTAARRRKGGNQRGKKGTQVMEQVPEQTAEQQNTSAPPGMRFVPIEDIQRNKRKLGHI